MHGQRNIKLKFHDLRGNASSFSASYAECTWQLFMTLITAETYFGFNFFANEEEPKCNYSLDVAPKSATTLALLSDGGSLRFSSTPSRHREHFKSSVMQ